MSKHLYLLEWIYENRMSESKLNGSINEYMLKHPYPLESDYKKLENMIYTIYS